MQSFRQLPCPTQGTGAHRRIVGKQRPQTLGDRPWIFGSQIELPITIADIDQRPWMTNQEKLHSMPP